MERRRIVWKRIICVVRGSHKWDERTLTRWCTKCFWLERKTSEGDWMVSLEDDNSDWMTPAQMRTYSDELLEYLKASEASGIRPV